MAHRSLTIRVGELFAEVCDSSVSTASWFLPKKPLADALKDKLKLDEIEKLNLQLLFRPDALPIDRFSDNKVAVAVTSGFEGLFAQVLEEKKLPLTNDFIFGISERIDSAGKVLKTVDQAECEIIAQKLKLMKIEQVIVASINSYLNSENQNTVASYFRDQGFQVFTSDKTAIGESQRWTELVEQAQWAHLIEDFEEQLSEIKKTTSISFERLHEVNFADLTLYAALDIFWLSGAGATPVILESQPNDAVEAGFFDSPEFRHLPQRNGPLLLGKSLRATALDLFLLDEPSIQIDGIVTAQFDRMRSRIEEALVTMSKGQQGMTRIDGAKVANDVLNIFVMALSSELKNLTSDQSVKIKGPLAKALIKHFKEIDSTLKCELVGET